MRTYEVIFIIRPDMPDADVDALIEQMQKVVTGTEGEKAEVVKADKWGKRTLAYRVAGQREGIYVLFEIQSGGKALHELERRLKVTEPVIKVFSVRVDLERKKIAKLAHKNEHRAARRQQKRASSSGSGDESRSSTAERGA